MKTDLVIIVVALCSMASIISIAHAVSDIFSYKYKYQSKDEESEADNA